MKKLTKMISFSLALASILGVGVNAMDISSIDKDNLTYDEEQDYTQLMIDYCADGSEEALLKAAELEMQRNIKIEALGLEYEETAFFTLIEDPADIAEAVKIYDETGNIYGVSVYEVTASALNCREEASVDAAKIGSFSNGAVLTFLTLAEDENDEQWYEVTDGNITGWCKAEFLQPTIIETETVSAETASTDASTETASAGTASTDASTGTASAGTASAGTSAGYSDDDLYWLAAAITKEAGSNWLSDEHQLMVGNVILNRVASSAYPNTVYGVLSQVGQYPWVSSGVSITPTNRALANAKKLLEGTRVLPENVVYQSTATQGSGVHTSIYDATLGTTTYFCYR